MAQNQHQRQASNFTFHSKWPSNNLQQLATNDMNNPNLEENILFNIGSLQQQLEAFQKEYQYSDRKSFAPIKKEQLQKVFKYFKKYEPIYFSKILIKEMSYKFKKEVVIKKYKEGYYFGEVLEIRYDEKYTKKIKHGKGVLAYSLFDKNQKQSKRIYEGEWRNDKKCGLGFQRFIDGSVYHGNYVNNKPQGRGKFTNGQGQVYEGQWKIGVKEGKGFWQGIKGQTYMGEWKDGKPEGYGVYVSESGSRYEGEFKNALKHGEGIERFTNGDLYKGFFENDKPSGYGEYYWKNKSYFKGYFSNGLRTGQGLWKKNAGNSDKYQGQYQNDKKWGYGVFTWANGNVFKGSYQGDLRNGYGQMFWTDGSYYKGNWKDGVQHGKGELYVVREGLRIGVFQNNQIIEIQQEEPQEDLENEQNKRIQTKESEHILYRNLSKTSQMSIKSKNSKFSSLSKRKPVLTEKTYLKPLNIKASASSLINQNKDERRKFFSQSENGMRSVPLKKLIENTENSRYINKDKPTDFRISQKGPNWQKYNQSLDNSRVSKAQKPEKRRNRILHSSFYLHKFKKLKSPEKEVSDQKNYFNHHMNQESYVHT